MSCLQRKKRNERVSNRVKDLNKSKKPILGVYRSNKNFSAQVVDVNGRVLVTVTSSANEYKKALKGKTGMEIAEFLGAELVKKATKNGIKEVVFNKGSYRFIGRVKAFCEAVSKNGLLFKNKNKK